MSTANPLSPVHYSERNGVHSDRVIDGIKYHQSFGGQTTLDTFVRPSYRNDVSLHQLGGNPPSLTHGNFGTMLEQ